MKPIKNDQKIRVLNTHESIQMLDDVGCPLDVIGLIGTPIPKDSDFVVDGRPPQQEFQFDPYPSPTPYRWWVPLTPICIEVLQ